MIFEDVWTDFQKRCRKIKALQEIETLMTWDMRTAMPQQASDRRAEMIGRLSANIFRLSTGSGMKRDLAVLEQERYERKLNPEQKALVRLARREFDKQSRIPENLYEEYAQTKSRSQNAWSEAKKNNDFAGFCHYLEKIIEANRTFAQLWGYEEQPYDALLDQYEEGMTVRRYDHLFQSLGKGISALLDLIRQRGVAPDDSIFRRQFDPQKQRMLSLNLLKAIGFDLNSGRLDQSEHPFTLAISSPYDVRLTAKFVPDRLTFGMMAVLHEGGHGIYEQNMDPRLSGTLLARGASEGIHESQSRLYENMIGRSRFFWEANFHKVLEIFPDEFSHVTCEAFYRALNCVRPSLIRTEADELTYNLHIMVRYDIEKSLLSGDCRVKDLPEIWKSKMKEYLGVEPETHGQGVLQDIHWAAGALGYFPSYALGNLYAAQFMQAVEREIPDCRKQIASGDMEAVNRWLREHVHRYGSLLTPEEMIRNATGEAVSSTHLMRYLTEKYTWIYRIPRAASEKFQWEGGDSE